jgi:hypothetical protein
VIVLMASEDASVDVAPQATASASSSSSSSGSDSEDEWVDDQVRAQCCL